MVVAQEEEATPWCAVAYILDRWPGARFETIFASQQLVTDNEAVRARHKGHAACICQNTETNGMRHANVLKWIPVSRKSRSSRRITAISQTTRQQRALSPPSQCSRPLDHLTTLPSSLNAANHARIYGRRLHIDCTPSHHIGDGAHIIHTWCVTY